MLKIFFLNWFKFGKKYIFELGRFVHISCDYLRSYISMKKMVFINLCDLTAFFDKESLRDVMNSLYEVKVAPRTYRNYYRLNKETSIQVKTESGLSEIRRSSISKPTEPGQRSE